MNYYQPYNQFQNSMYTQPQYTNQSTPINNISAINGRFVSDFNEIRPDEISMSGTPSIFIKNDLSQICVKKWLSNGCIDTNIYELKQEESKKNIFDSIDYELLEEKINKIDSSFSKRIDRLERLIKKNEDD